MKPYRVTPLLATLIVVAAVSLLALPAAPVIEAKPLDCGPDQVPVGTTCVDKFEASVWSIPAAQTNLIKKVQEGKATLADLTAGGAFQVSPSPFCLPDFPSSFDLTGNWTSPLYAASVAGVPPTACISWFQAEQACALSGKRLLTNQEWQRAAAGTVDPGENDGLANAKCNTDANDVRNTGLAGAPPPAGPTPASASGASRTWWAMSGSGLGTGSIKGPYSVQTGPPALASPVGMRAVSAAMGAPEPLKFQARCFAAAV